MALLRPTSIKHQPVRASCTIVAIAALCLHLDASANTLLCLLPALALGALLLCTRRYPGERLLSTIRRSKTRPSTRTASQTPTPAPHDAWYPRGGLLIALSLAVRPPPPALLMS